MRIAAKALWPRVARRVEKTIRQVEAREFTETLIHLATVYGVLSAAYYSEGRSLVSDGAYDALCGYLLEHYDETIAQGTYGTILKREMLEAGSGYHFANEGTLPYSAQTIFDILREVRLPEYVEPAPVVRKRTRPTKFVRTRARPKRKV
jgi:hypothetical protein